jgi:phosphoglycerate dehydrogenase-like enzyme
MGMSRFNEPGRRPQVAVLDDYQDAAPRAADWGPLQREADVQFFRDHLADERALVERLSAFDVAIAMRERTPFPRSLLAQLPRLRLLVTTGLRNASIDVGAARELGITVSGTEGLPYPTAELTWGLILALARRIPHEDRATREGAWQTSVGVGLSGKTLGILGLGRLGTRVAQVGAAFGMTVVAWSPNLTEARAASAGVQLVSQRALLETADVLSIHLVLSERTRHLLGAKELAAMKRSALLINTSRGPIVDEAALVAALREGKIAGAGLDVFDHEPLPPTHPLRKLPNTVITPHLGYVTEETYRIFYTQAIEDALGYLAGTPQRTL